MLADWLCAAARIIKPSVKASTTNFVRTTPGVVIIYIYIYIYGDRVLSPVMGDAVRRLSVSVSYNDSTKPLIG